MVSKIQYSIFKQIYLINRWDKRNNSLMYSDFFFFFFITENTNTWKIWYIAYLTKRKQIFFICEAKNFFKK